MLNKTGQTNGDMQWLKAVPPVKPVAPVVPNAAASQKPAATDTTRFIQSAQVAEGLLYTEAILQHKEERLLDPKVATQQDTQHNRSLADLPYLVHPELAGYKKTVAAGSEAVQAKTAGVAKGQTQEKSKLPFDSPGVWVAVAFVALCVMLVMWWK